MPNLYQVPANLKTDVGILVATTKYDGILLRLLEDVSRAVDELCHRQFYSAVATRLYGDHERVNTASRELWLPDDLISVTTLKVDDDGDGTFETTLVSSTDYWLWPYNPPAHNPYNRIDLNPRSTLRSAWPLNRRRVQLVGKFGFSDEFESAGTLGAAISDTTGTSVTMTAGHTVLAGDTIRVDTEDLYVTVVATNTLTVTRALNGSTAATHANAAAVTRRRYHRSIERAVLMQATRLFRDQQTGYSGAVANAEFGGYQFSSLYPAIRDLLAPLVVPAVG
mgnify:CR=1 FL=1